MPFLPQLPARGADETMLGQAIAPLLGVHVTDEGGGLVIDRVADVAIADEIVLAESRFAALRAFTRALDKHPVPGPVKLQVAGPTTLAVALTRAGVAPREARRLAAGATTRSVLALAAAVRAPVVMFLDEPSLVLWARSDPPWPRLQMVDDLAAAVQAIAQAGAVSGVHVCGDGDVAAAVDARTDVVGVEVVGAPKWLGALNAHRRRDGVIAWAAVPVRGVVDIAGIAHHLADLAPDGHGLVTPTCGLAGAADEQCARRVLTAAETLAQRQAAVADAARK